MMVTMFSNPLYMLQTTVKKQLSQLFRNKRRRSEVPQPKEASKNTTSDLCSYAAPSDTCAALESEDHVSFERNCTMLKKEAGNKFPRVDLMHGLLTQTHNRRKILIQNSKQAAGSILEEHSYLKDSRWVWYVNLNMQFIFNCMFCR